MRTAPRPHASPEAQAWAFGISSRLWGAIGLCALLVGAAPSAARAGEPVTPPMTFHAPFDGSTDARGPHGAVSPVEVRGPVTYRPGRSGQALLCGDGGASLVYANESVLYPSSGTVEMWVCPVNWTGAESTFHVFLEARDPGWLAFYRFYQGGIVTLLGTAMDAYRAALSPLFRWQPGQWHHIAGTWRRTGLEVYVDGQRVATVSSPLIPDRLPTTFRLGDDPWHIPRDQQTLIDEVRIYSVPLDAEQIAAAARGETVSPTPRVCLDLQADPDTERLHLIVDAAGWAGDVAPGKEAYLALVSRTSGETVARSVATHFDGGVAEVDLSVAGLTEGEYDISASLRDASGAVIAEASAPFTKPGPPVWSGNTLGMEDVVLPPWTPVEVNRATTTTRCWGREYAFDTFLSQATSAGRELLSAPVRVEAVVKGEPVTLSGRQCVVTRATDTQVALRGALRTSGLVGVVRHEVEYDGYTWTEITLTPERETPLDELRLVWRMPAAQASLMYADARSWTENPGGALPPDGWKSAFVHCFWLGNEERGLCWYTETKQHWRPSEARPAIEVTREGDEVKVVVRLIAEPYVVTSPLRYGFGMMATPVRPRPEGASAWRMAPGANPTFEIIWPNANMRYYGHTEPLDPEGFAKRVVQAQAAGVRIVPYVNLNYISAGVPEWRYYGRRWADPARVTEPSDVAAMGHPSMGTCPASRDWQDFILYRINEMVDRYHVDGVYIDCWDPAPCRAEPCGWRDETGAVQGARPIRAYRQILKRVATLFHQKRPDPLLMVHMSSQMNIPMLSFSQTTLDGEQFVTDRLADDYLPLLPPDRFRAEFMGRNWGPVSFFLPELRDPHLLNGTRNLAPYLLLHDVGAWPIWSDLETWNRLYAALDRLDVARARFHPYWTAPVASGSPGVLTSAHTVPGRAILTVMNTGEATRARLELDLARLGLPAIGSATDVLRDEPLSARGGRLTVPLGRHQGRVIELLPPRAP